MGDHQPGSDIAANFVSSGCFVYIPKAAWRRSSSQERSAHAITAGVERAVLPAVTSRLIRSRMACAGSDESCTGNLGHARVIASFRKAKDTFIDT